MPQNGHLEDFNPGVDKAWGSFASKPESEQRSSEALDAMAGIAGRAIVNAGEHEQRRINQQRGIVSFDDGEVTALVFNDKSTDIISFNTGAGPDHHKYVNSHTGTHIIQTESGNQYVVNVDEGIIISARGEVFGEIYTLPDIEFGKQWEIEGKFKTTPVKQMLTEYKQGDIAGDFHREGKSPFTEARQRIDLAIDFLNKKS